jgi:hypothetical protein
MRALPLRVLAVSAILLSLAGCSTYRDQLARSQHAYEVNEHERALALLRDLERNLPMLAQPEQAQYCYLRGMTDYRMGYRADARHWLALARSYDENSPGVLPADWKARLGEALDELNDVVYTEGLAALAKKADREEDKGDKPKAKAKKPAADAPRAPKSDAPKSDAPKQDAPKSDAPKQDAPKHEPSAP